MTNTENHNHAQKFFIETYGCQMNVADSELITSILKTSGLEHTDDIELADIIIFNTCSVRQHAEDRVLGRITNERKRKLLKPNLKIGIVGCMAQRIGKSLIELDRTIDFAVGVDQYSILPEVLSGVIDEYSLYEHDSSQVYENFVPMHSNKTCAFVTIMRGCNNFCSYCIVPHLRGRERSRKKEQVITEVAYAVDNGMKDITLLGQNVNSYHSQNTSFPQLLSELCNLSERYRLRFITSHPKDLSDELIEVMATEPYVCKHIHLPLQSGNDEVLQRMNRNYQYKQYLSLIHKLRSAIPEIAITTDLIAGFPGETEIQFMDTVNAMKEIEFDHAFCFKYSNREGTTAADFSEQVEESVRLDRLQRMIELQREITLRSFQNKIGKQVEIYVENISRKNQHQVSGKTDDFKIAVVDGSEKDIGKFIRARVVSATSGTLICQRMGNSIQDV